MSGFFGMVRQDGKAIDEGFLQRIAEELGFGGTDGKNVWSLANVGGCFAWMQTGPARQASQQPVGWHACQICRREEVPRPHLSIR